MYSLSRGAGSSLALHKRWPVKWRPAARARCYYVCIALQDLTQYFLRRCDSIFSFAEITGSSLGRPVGQSVLNVTMIGVVVNGKFYTWNAAMTRYDNGYEAGFGITNELFEVLTGKIESLFYVTPDGDRVSMPIGGFRQAIQSAFDTCAKRFR